eukprot:TRINITY_DN2638_c0_g1_i1.p3 TRINITY_DN2638_c0_g1~~TRINITY_DN2638_c0_g1_i1.p3  ORF type:complete len:134 (+),score=10.00 TRINITY_DN2638_c0_g1_i1:135-536(+)
MTNFNKATTGGSFAVKEQVETSPTKHKHSCEQQEQIVEDNEGFSTTGPTNSSSRSESTTNANLETAQSVDQMTQSPHISDRKAPNIITFEDLIAGKTKFKVISAMINNKKRRKAMRNQSNSNRPNKKTILEVQ